MFKRNILTLVLLGILLVSSLFSVFVGVLEVNPNQLLAADQQAWFLLLASRLPRLLAILCTGMGMSVAGLIMQNLCRNKFISPTTGATLSSAQFGILITLLFLPQVGLLGRTLTAFVFAMLGTSVFVYLTQRIPFKEPIMVPLIGVMFGNIISGITSFLAYKYEMTQAMTSWLIGHFSMVLRGRYEMVYLIVPLLIIAFIYARQFNIVGMGKQFATNLGISYSTVLMLGLAIVAMITASVVVVVGSISYIGLIVPNMVAMIKGDNLRGTMVDTALFGALFVLWCDIIARSLIMPYEVPIELIIGMVGGLLFIGLLTYRLRDGKARGGVL